MTIRKFEDFANSGEINSIYIGGTDASIHKVMTSGDIAISEDWIAITSFSNSWEASANASYPPQYKKLKNQMVLLEGLIVSGSPATDGTGKAFTLPIGYRPNKAKIATTVANNLSIVLIYINTDGTVELRQESGTGEATTWTSLFGLSFLAEA